MRLDLTIIQSWVNPDSRVLDLGCGDGTLLQTLATEKNVTGYGLEIDGQHIAQCIANQVNVIEHNLDTDPLDRFQDQSFDTVIMTQAIQTMRYPDKMVEEMLRIGRECIVTFPNFGNWRARFYLLFRGRMPVSDLLPFEWYNTPNIHFCTFKDFEVLCHERGIVVQHREVVPHSWRSAFWAKLLPNLFGETAIYHLTPAQTPQP